MLAEIHKVQAVPDIGCAELLPKSLAALIRLDDREYLLYSFQVRGPLRFPVARPWDAERRQLVIPERLGVALALAQHHVTGLADLLQTLQTVKHGLAP